MKTIVKRPTEINITHLLVQVPVNYDDEDIPYDFPLRVGDEWTAKINIDTGEVSGWPVGESRMLDMKVTDGGSFYLLDGEEKVASIEGDYVPSGLGIGSGDYIELKIGADGMIWPWPKHPNVAVFFRDRD